MSDETNSIGLKIAALLFEAYPGLDRYEDEAVARASACLTFVLGGVVAGLRRDHPELFDLLMKKITNGIIEMADSVVDKAKAKRAANAGNDNDPFKSFRH